jgi:hypothetical protein
MTQSILEMVDTDEGSLRAFVRGELKAVWTALPVIITKASDGHIAQAKSSINAIIMQIDGTLKSTPMPLFDTAPVHFAGGGGVTATHPVAIGDEGMMIFSQANQDGWHQSGGVQDPVDARSHHPADSRFIPGGRSDPRKLNPPASSSSHQTRSDNGAHVNDVHPSNGLTHTSTVKDMTVVAQSATSHLPDKLIKVAQKILLNTIPVDNIQPGPITMANKKAIAPKPPPALGPMTNSMASAFASVITGGAGAVLTNPTAAANGALSSAVASGASAINTALGAQAASIVAAMTGGGGLNPTLASLATMTDNHSGVIAPTGGAFGLADLLSHVAMLDTYFGTNTSFVPTNVNYSNATGPISSAPTLATMLTSVNSIAAAVIAGSMTVAAGTTAITALTAQISALMTASTTAITTLQASAVALSNVAQAAAAVGAFGPREATLGALLANASTALTSLANLMASMWTPDAGELAAMATFPDAGAAQQGATGSL